MQITISFSPNRDAHEIDKISEFAPRPFPLINLDRVMSTRTEFALGSSIGQSAYLTKSRQVGREAGERTQAAKKDSRANRAARHLDYRSHR
jgi:hypothetical protein